MSQVEFNQQLCDFLAVATTPFHAVSAMSSILEAAGFESLSSNASAEPLAPGKYFLTRNDSSLVAFIVAPMFRLPRACAWLAPTPTVLA